MKVLVTGGTGFVGSHVTRQLIAAGHDVRLLVRNPDKAIAYYQSLTVPVPELLQGDITDARSIATAMHHCDALVHTAATTPVAINAVDKLFAVNVGGTQKVMDAALAAGARSIVYVSSITAVFNTDGSKVTADAPLTPSSMPYGRSKVEAEHYVRQLQRRGAPVAIVYPGGIIGPDDPGFSDAFKALQHRINHGFRIFGNGGIQHIDVRDLAAMIVSLVTQMDRGRYLLPGPYCQWTELADIIEDVSGCRLQRIPARGWTLRLMGRLLDCLRWVKTVDSPVSAETMRYATLWPNIENSAALQQRGITLRSTRQTFADSLQWMLSAGYLKPEQVPKLQQ